jgi:hypothetical protein
MRIELDANSLGYGCKGLEIGVIGFQSNPTDTEDEPSQVFIEVYEGQLRVHVWDGHSQDPATTLIAPSPAR